jgi:hypothetical protein
MAEAIRVSAGRYRVGNQTVTAKSAAEALKKVGVSSSDKKSSTKTTTSKTKTTNLDEELKVKDIDNEAIKKNVADQSESAINFGKKLADDLDDPNAFKKISTERREEEKQALDLLKNEYQNALTRSPESTLAMQRFQAGLEGLNSAEGMALRETARRELDSQFNNQLALARANAARSGVRGGAANAQQLLLSNARAKAQGNLEQDLTLQNYGIKQQALQNFGNFVNQTEGREGQQRLQSAGLLGNQLNVQAGRDIDRETFNINQDTNRSLNRTQTVLGGAGINAGLLGNERANWLAQENMRINSLLGREQTKQGQQAVDAYQKQLNSMYGR